MLIVRERRSPMMDLKRAGDGENGCGIRDEGRLAGTYLFWGLRTSRLVGIAADSEAAKSITFTFPRCGRAASL